MKSLFPWTSICLIALAAGCSHETKQAGSVPNKAQPIPEVEQNSDPPEAQLSPEEIREFQLRAEQLLALFFTNKIGSYDASFGQAEFGSIHQTTDTLRKLRDGKPTALSECELFDEVLQQPWVLTLTAAPVMHESPTRDEIIAAAGDPEKQETGEYKYDKQREFGGKETVTLPVDWYHWAWASVAIEKADGKCAALRINAERRRKEKHDE